MPPACFFNALTEGPLLLTYAGASFLLVGLSAPADADEFTQDPRDNKYAVELALRCLPHFFMTELVWNSIAAPLDCTNGINGMCTTAFLASAIARCGAMSYDNIIQ